LAVVACMKKRKRTTQSRQKSNAKNKKNKNCNKTFFQMYIEFEFMDYMHL